MGVHVCVGVCVCLFVYVCLFVCVCVCVFVCTYVWYMYQSIPKIFSNQNRDEISRLSVEGVAEVRTMDIFFKTFFHHVFFFVKL